MKRVLTTLMLFFLLPVFAYTESVAGNENAVSIRDMVITEKTEPFSFRNGVTWGMNPQQVSLIEDVPTEQRTTTDWAVMITAEPVQVSRFSADLVYMFYRDALRMITYEFQNDCSTLNYQYLTGALCSVYGESREADPIAIKSWMDRIYQDYYRQDMIRQALEWKAEDGTSIYLYYYTDTTYAILYVCPVSNGGNSGYETNGL